MRTSRDPPLTATLPFHFNTAEVVTWIVRAIAALVCVLAVGVLYSVLVSRSTAAATALFVIGAGVVVFARVVLRTMEGTRGVITRDLVVVHPGGVLGMRMAGPDGRFTLQRFKEIRVDRVLPPANVQASGHERVLLVGNEGTPEILVVITELDVGRTFGRDLAAALDLPFDERLAPY